MARRRATVLSVFRCSAISVPAGNDRGPLYMDQTLAALHAGMLPGAVLTLGIVRHTGEVTLCFGCEASMQGIVEGQLYAQYPDAKIAPLSDHALPQPPAFETWSAELHLEHDLFPIKRYVQFEDALNRQTADPLTAILTAVADAAAFTPTIEMEIRRASRKRSKRARRVLRKLASPFFRVHHHVATLYVRLAFSRVRLWRCVGWLLGRLAHARGASELKPLDTSGSRQHDREEDLQAGSDKEKKLLFEVCIRLRVTAPPGREKDAKRTLQEIAGPFGQFSARGAAFRVDRIRTGHGRRRPRTFLLSTEELATLWHPSTSTVRAPTMTTVQSREAEPPVALPTPDAHPGLAVLGVAQFRCQEQHFGILPDDRRRHLYVVGKTGMGKSTLLQRLLQSDIAAGRGVALIDPHGDLARDVLHAVPSHRTNDVVLFDPGDRAFPFSFNILACGRSDQRELVASGIIAAFKKIWGDAIRSRSEHILRNALLTLLEIPGATLLDIPRLLSNAEYRESIVSRVSDPVVRDRFWGEEFQGWRPRLQAEYCAPIENKVGAFTTSPLLRHIIGQRKSRIDVRTIMDEGKILIMNLSKGRMGEDASALLGSFFVTALQLAGMSRADVPESERTDFSVYVDEFQNFATPSFATILSEARKYRLNLICSHQYLAQVDEATLSAVFGNVGSMVVFQVGVEDSEPLAAQLGGELTPKDLLALPKFHAYCRLLIDGYPSRPFSFVTQPPPPATDPLRPHKIRNYTRYRYARPVEHVKREIARAFALT